MGIRKVFYTNNQERDALISQAEGLGEVLREDAITIEGNYLIFVPREEADDPAE